MLPMTFSEKVLAQASGHSEVHAGDIVTVTPDWLLSHDNTAAIARIFHQTLGTRVRFPERLIIALDHASPPPTPRHAQNHASVRDFVAQQGIQHFFDVGEGISHQLLSEARLLLPGQILLGADSHTLHQGWQAVFAAGVGRTEMAALWATGQTWLRVPESVKVEVVGALPSGVTAKDAALELVHALGSDGARYATVEFHGPGLETLSPSQRMTIANMMAETGAKNVYFPPDEATRAFYASPEQADQRMARLHPDAEASYRAVYRLDLSRVGFYVACPHQVAHGCALSTAQGKPIHEAFIGTCTNGRLEDLAAAAQVLQGQRVHPGVRLIVVPASRRVLEEALARGYIQTLVQAGAIIGAPGCGPCMGNHFGVPAPGEVVVSTANRNFRGRMGEPHAEIYLASPRVVAASAIAGHLAAPEEIRHAAPARAVVQITASSGRHPRQRTPLPFPTHRGRVWVYGDHIDTDRIFPGKYTYTLQTPAEIAAHVLEDLDPDFPTKVQPGDVLVVGENFGHGSSREQAVTALKYAGIAAVVAKSFARIFYRNAVNQGLPVLESPEAVEAARTGDTITLVWSEGLLKIRDQQFTFRAPQGLAGQILRAGGLVPFLRQSQEI